VSERGAAKLSRRLAKRIDSVDGSSPVEVIVELQPLNLPTAGSRQERMAAAKQRFELELRSVADKITEAGGQVLETAWLNQTVRSRIPAREVPRVAEDDTVSAIDLPGTITPEGQPADTRPAP
jgi:hypothetical protein